MFFWAQLFNWRIGSCLTWASQVVLSQGEIGAFYLDRSLKVPSFWNLGRKHFRAVLCDGRFFKLNHFENRLNEKALRFYCYKLKPMHVYFSVLNWLFPERVSKKCRARYCVPLNGEYVIDVDSYLVVFRHDHKVDDHWYVCNECLDMSKRLTLQLSEIISEYYSKIGYCFQWLCRFPRSCDGL